MTSSSVDDHLRAALAVVADDASRKTSTPIVIPVRQILDAVHAALPDLPRIPRYDSQAHERVWSDEAPHSVTELHPDPPRISAYRDGARVSITVEDPDHALTMTLDPVDAESFALHLLAAARHTPC